MSAQAVRVPRHVALAHVVRHRVLQQVAERVHLQIPSTKHTAGYLRVKREKLGHLLTVPEEIR